MNELYLLKGCELHMHVVGAFYADDALALGRTVYRDVNWHANRFLETYQALFGVRPDPIGVFDDAITNSDLALLPRPALMARLISRRKGRRRSGITAAIVDLNSRSA